MLLAALNARRPTRDIDFAARAIDNDTDAISRVVRQIAAISLDDGIEFDGANANAETIREEDAYSGVRVTLSGTLSRATLRLHVDVNVGDPIWPEPQNITLPRLLDGALVVRGYPLEMVLAEKRVTAIARGTASTRWRDFVDIYMLVQRHPVDGRRLQQSMSPRVESSRRNSVTSEGSPRRVRGNRAGTLARLVEEAAARCCDPERFLGRSRRGRVFFGPVDCK